MSDLYWYPKSVIFIVNGKKYEGYKTPMTFLIASITWINLHNQNK